MRELTFGILKVREVNIPDCKGFISVLVILRDGRFAAVTGTTN